MRIAIPVLLILVFAAACSGGDKNSDEADDSPTTDAVAEPTATSTEDAASPTPTEAAGVRAEAAMYIDGGGSGVAIRDACEDTARTGDAWPDGTEVAVVQVGAGTCEGWSLVLEGKGSWVRDEYLTDEKPATVATRPSSGTGTQPSPTNGGGTQPKPAATSAPIPPLKFVSLQGEPITSDDLPRGAFLRGGATGFQYLGLITNVRVNAKSVCNSIGIHGSKTSELSVRNPEGVYGIAYTGDIYHPNFNSQYSAYNNQAIQPPSIILNDVRVASLSTNGAVGSIHPDTLFFYLGCAY